MYIIYIAFTSQLLAGPSLYKVQNFPELKNFLGKEAAIPCTISNQGETYKNMYDILILFCFNMYMWP